ncbi:hypothetical protein LJ739_07840 [Aestuariibacter halophilus]|uniref:Thiazolylpeptide-type bacteriocin n=1 Tax=Fluctibacter halophilus TaxID=226011 RepID=A0ABS8G6E2_9ALTE|nr:hypothetical protein [Aestuariibacter halophilus]MCC2616147.1 hypothetical protein [Aestuariibacter halophilus]
MKSNSEKAVEQPNLGELKSDDLDLFADELDERLNASAFAAAVSSASSSSSASSAGTSSASCACCFSCLCSSAALK